MTDRSKVKKRVELRELRYKQVEQAILKDVGASRALRKLVGGGADRAIVFGLLVGSVYDCGFWREEARRLKRRLETTAEQLETVASHSERVHEEFHSHSLVMVLLLHIYSGKCGTEDPEWKHIWERAISDRGSSTRNLFRFMRLYAKNCRAKATHLGKLLREFPPRQRRGTLDALMFVVWQGTRKHHDREIAYLLTKAFEASGSKKQFSEDQVKKHRQRYVLPRIRQYLERRAPDL